MNQQLQVHKYSERDFEISLSPPTIIDPAENLLRCEISIQSSDHPDGIPFYFQTCRTKYTFDSDKNQLRLLFDPTLGASRIDQFYELLQIIERELCSKLSEISHTYFSRPIEENVIRQKLLKSIFHVPEKLSEHIYVNLSISDDIEVYNKSRIQISKESLSVSNVGTFILRPTYLYISRTQTYFDLQVIMCLLDTRPQRNKTQCDFIDSDSVVGNDNNNDCGNFAPPLSDEIEVKKFDLGI